MYPYQSQMTNRKLLTTFLFLITNPIHSFYAQSFLFLNYPLRLHPVPRAGRQCGQLNFGVLGAYGGSDIFRSLFSLFQSHLDSCLYGPTDPDTGGGELHALPVHYSWSLPGLCQPGPTGGGVCRSALIVFIFIGRQSP